MSYRIVHIYKNGVEKYITSHPVENNKWRSSHKEDARIFQTVRAAKRFIDEKYEYPIDYRIEEAI